MESIIAIIMPICLLTSAEIPPIIPKYGTDYFYTNRSSFIEDTLYLPIEKYYILRVDVSRYIDKLQKINNSQYIQTTHLSLTKDILQDREQDIKDFCYIPIHYKRILPFFTSIYNVDSAEQIKYDKTKEQLVDVVYLHQDTASNIQYWGTEYKTVIGGIIADYMPYIEMFLWKKITNEITLVNKNRELISDNVIIHVLPLQSTNE